MMLVSSVTTSFPRILRRAHRRCSSLGRTLSTQQFERIDTAKLGEGTPKWVEYEYDEVPSGPLYDTHIPTSCFQKAILAVSSSAAAITDVYRADMVATFGEVTGQCAFEHMAEQMERSEEGRRILEQAPRINTKTVDYTALSQMPENTLGYKYAKFLRDNRISSDDRPPVHFVDDAKLAYVATRYREVHDLFHVLLDMPTNMLGEVVVKWVEAFQTHLPMAATGGLFGALRLKPKQQKLYITSYLPWALKTGYESLPFMPIYFEERWSQDIEELRRELRIPPLPPRPQGSIL